MSAEPWFEPEWPAPANVRALITRRTGGSSAAPYESFNLALHVGDVAAHVAENRRRLRSQLPAEPMWLDQVHGTRVIDADGRRGAAAADAAVARSAGKVLAVLTADCLPVLLCDRAGTAVGIAHAGWRGLASGVIENAVSALGGSPAELLAHLGPAIGPDAYEVGEEVRQAFIAHDPAAARAFRAGAAGKHFADLYELARQRLSKAGIMAVFGGRRCTFHEPESFFSYRRDGVTGRMASLIWLERA